MASTPKPTKKSRAQLERQVLELEAQLAHVYHFADATIHKCSTDRMMASGVLVQLTALGGAELVLPFVVRDGLSAETIAALRSDIHRSYDRTVEFKPKPL